MIRLFTQTPRLLQHGHIIKFSEGFNVGETTRYAGNYYQVSLPQQVSFDRWYILPDGPTNSNDYKDVDLSNASSGTENIYPHDISEVYEVLMGFAGDALIYPIIPTPDRMFAKLGYTGMIPDITSTSKRYLGCYKRKDTPYATPRLRLTFVKDVDAMVLRLFADAGKDYEKVSLGFLINRCRITKLNSPTPTQVEVARDILHYSELKKGGE